MTSQERRDRFEETHRVAATLIAAQTALRCAKTARLRELRLAQENVENELRCERQVNQPPKPDARGISR